MLTEIDDSYLRGRHPPRGVALTTEAELDDFEAIAATANASRVGRGGSGELKAQDSETSEL